MLWQFLKMLHTVLGIHGNVTFWEYLETLHIVLGILGNVTYCFGNMWKCYIMFWECLEMLHIVLGIVGNVTYCFGNTWNAIVIFRTGACYFEHTLQCIQFIFNSWQAPVCKKHFYLKYWVFLNVNSVFMLLFHFRNNISCIK